MPLYMDVHRNLGAVTADALAEAHKRDLEVQGRHGVAYHQYWFNEDTGAVFCLVEGPDRETCERVHREAHGLVADELIEVEPRLVEAFLGSVHPNPAGAAVHSDGHLDSGMRIVLFTQVGNFTEIAHQAGDDVALRVIEAHDRIVREILPQHGGREIRHTGEGLMVCFGAASNALRFAQQAHAKCEAECEPIGGFKPQLRIGIAAGEPVEANRDLFGVSVAKARRVCELAGPGQTLVTAAVRELAVGKIFNFQDRGSAQLPGVAESLQIFALQSEPQAQAPRKEKRVEKVRAFWGELKRRHVVSVGLVYAAVLFVMLQVAELTFTPLGLPPWAYTLLLVLGLFGFPLALVLAWAFDLTD